MTQRVYSKLYTSTVEPILMYGSGIWGTKQFSCISSIHNKACKFFLSVGKHTSNIAARGDMGWTSCFTKQRVNFRRLWCRFLHTSMKEETRINKLNVRDVIHNVYISTKCVMRTVSDTFLELDNTEWFSELFDDRRNLQTGNKLRTYRRYKNSVQSEQYIKVRMSRMERQTMALFRSRALPIEIETGRYSRPSTPVDDCATCVT
jgi:hypothetical protein